MKITILAFCYVLFLGLTVFAQPGSLDTSFDPGGASSTIYTTSIQNDGKIIIGGSFTSCNGTTRSRIARLNADGTLDTTFNPGTGVNPGAYNVVVSTAIQNDGKIIIGGYFQSYTGTPRNCIARLNTDGSLDTTFDPGTGANASVSSIAIQPDGKIIIGGGFTDYNGAARNHIARLNADGSLDTSFNPGTGANSEVLTTTIQNDGKIIIGGYFTSYNGSVRNYIARLNADGSLDTSFNPGTGANSYVFTTAIQNDEKIIIGGQFGMYNGTGRARIARLNADGSLDTSFNPGTGVNSGQFNTNNIRTLAIQSDGKIIIGGKFETYSGSGRNCIAYLNTDGSLDITFNPGTGVSSIVSSSESIQTAAIQPDGKILISGNFTSYNNIGSNYIARLNAGGSCAITNVTVDNVSACDPLDDTYSVTLTVTYENEPTSGFLTINGSNTNITGSPQSVTINSLNADGVDIATSAYFTAESTCAHNVTWTAPASCSTTGINDLEQIVLTIYPNPTNSILNIEVNENTKIKIVNPLGETVAKQQLHTGNNNVDVSSFSNGIYFLTTENGTSIKFIKQ